MWSIWCALNSNSAKPYLPIIELLFEAGAIVWPEFENRLVRPIRRKLESAVRGNCQVHWTRRILQTSHSALHSAAAAFADYFLDLCNMEM
jgi:hypothetical protein